MKVGRQAWPTCGIGSLNLRAITNQAVRCWEVGRWTSAGRLCATCMFAVMVAPMPRVSTEKFTFVPVRVISQRLVAVREDEAVFAQDGDECTSFEAGLIFLQQIQGVLNSEADTDGRMSQGASTTASLSLERYVSPCACKSMRL